MAAQANPRIFSLHGRALKLNSRADIEPFLKDLDVAQVEEIHLGGNTIGIEASYALADVLKQTKVLKIADFADIFTGRLITEIPLSLAAICDALTNSTTLVELDLSDNAFGGRSAEPMVPFLTHNRTFQVLKLNNNGLGIAGGTTVANALLESARLSKAEGKTSNLRTVICGRNRLENGSAPVWAEAFAAHGTLVEVRMKQNGIRMEGIAALAEGLSKCKDLQHLDFQDNTCTASGSHAIAKALPAWPNLRSLNLSDCLLSTLGGVALFSVLAKGSNPKLDTLKLQFGELDRRALGLLAQAIADHLPDLTTLELNGNRVDPDDECIADVRSALESHNHGDALDELDEMEDPDEEEEESPAVQSDGEKSDAEEAVKQAVGKKSDDDALADMMAKVTIK